VLSHGFARDIPGQAVEVNGGYDCMQGVAGVLRYQTCNHAR
jgi:hypothetical protein